MVLVIVFVILSPVQGSLMFHGHLGATVAETGQEQEDQESIEPLRYFWAVFSAPFVRGRTCGGLQDVCLYLDEL